MCGMICGSKWIPQMVQRSLNKQTSLTLDRSPLSFSSLLIPLNGSHNPCKQLDSKCKTSISEKYPFPFRGSLVHQQSLAKQPQHHPKSHLKRDPNKKQKRVIRFSIFAFKLVSKFEPKESENRFGGHWGRHDIETSKWTSKGPSTSPLDSK